MARDSAMAPEGVHKLTTREARKLLDRQARQHFNMGWREFVAAWKRGDFAKEPDTPDLMWLVMLLPLASPSNGAE